MIRTRRHCHGEGPAGWENPSLGVSGTQTISVRHSCLWEGVPKGPPGAGLLCSCGSWPRATRPGWAGACGTPRSRPTPTLGTRSLSISGELVSPCSGERGWLWGLTALCFLGSHSAPVVTAGPAGRGFNSGKLRSSSAACPWPPSPPRSLLPLRGMGPICPPPGLGG